MILAFGWGIYSTGLKLGEIKARNAIHISRYAADAIDQIEHICLGGDMSGISDCVAEAIRSTNEDQRAQDDLEAQTKMAFWAFWMLISTVVMAIVTALGVFYVWRTLLATQDMARDTREIGEAQITTGRHEVALAHPPRFKITRPVFYVPLKGKPKDYSTLPDFRPGTQVCCRCFLMNYGRYTATIAVDDNIKKPLIDAYLYFAKDGIIPMHEAIVRYQGVKEWTPPSGIDLDNLTAKPGASTHDWNLSATVPDGFSQEGGGKIYVIGSVRYTGSAGDSRGYYFCKRYLPEEQRFEDAEEYENED